MSSQVKPLVTPRKCYKCKEPLLPTMKIKHGLHSACFCRWFKVHEDDDFYDVVAHPAEASSSPSFSTITSSFFHGRFRKYSAQLGSKTYLLKVQQEGYPELPAMEYLCINLLALDTRIHNSFVSTKRQEAFIRLIHRRFEELCHAL